jgi:hypothetical protein
MHHQQQHPQDCQQQQQQKASKKGSKKLLRPNTSHQQRPLSATSRAASAPLSMVGREGVLTATTTPHRSHAHRTRNTSTTADAAKIVTKRSSRKKASGYIRN